MIRAAMAGILLACAGLAQGQSAVMSLSELIAALQRQGHSIVYSSSLVHSGLRVRVDTVDMDSLKSALPGLGLALEEREGVWVLVRGDTSTVEEGPSPEPDIALRSLETVIVTGTLYRFPQAGTASSAHSFNSTDMSLVPSVASDAMRVTLRLPGVSSVGVSAKPQIRGGLKGPGCLSESAEATDRNPALQLHGCPGPYRRSVGGSPLVSATHY